MKKIIPDIIVTIVLFLVSILAGCGGNTLSSDNENEYSEPVAMDRRVSVLVNTSSDIQLQAYDADGDMLQYFIINNPANGSLTQINLSKWRYTPAAGFTGTDSFTFHAYDGLVYSNTATITLVVQSSNTPPVAQNLTVSTNRDVPVRIQLAGSDGDGDNIRYSVVNAPKGTYSLDDETGIMDFTPEPSYLGTDTFTYKVSDYTATGEWKSDSLAATVTITIGNPETNNPPVPGQSSYDLETPEDTELTFTVAGSDADGSTLTLAPADQMISGGELTGITRRTVGGDPVQYFDCVFKPDLDFHCEDDGDPVEFHLTLSDGIASADITVRIMVTSQNDAPTVTGPVVYRLSADSTDEQSLTLAGSDVDNDTLIYSIVDGGGPSEGTLTLSGNGPQAYYTLTGGTTTATRDTFSYTIDDGIADPVTVNATIYFVEEGTWYVDGEEGDDDSDGMTVETPFKTVGKALSAAGTDDTINVNDGEYILTGTVGSPVLIGNVTIRRYASATENPSITVQPGEYGYITITGNVTLNNLDFVDCDSLSQAGGCLRITGTGNSVQDCNFRNNRALAAGAVSLEDGAIANIIRCIFAGNSAGDADEGTAGNGGAIRLTGGSNLTVGQCTFNINTAVLNGGAIQAEDGSVVTVTGSNFHENTADDNGGAISLEDESSAVMTNCTFTSNRAGVTGETANGNGGAVQVGGGSSIDIDGCTFQDNTAVNPGGAICSTGTISIKNISRFITNQARNGGALYLASQSGITSVSIDGSTFQGNEARSCGGAVYLYGCGTITDSTFTNNSSSGEGGAMYCDGTVSGSTQSVVDGCDFTDNSSVKNGGAVYAYHVSYVFRHTLFNDNTAAGIYHGGAIYSRWYSSIDMVNCLMYANDAAGGGGCAIEGYSNLNVICSTLAGNTATSGRGLYLKNGSCAVSNSIVWAGEGVSPYTLATGGSINITNSCVVGADPASGNLNDDPRFVNAISGAPYYLKANGTIFNPASPCIDAGSKALLLEQVGETEYNRIISLPTVDGLTFDDVEDEAVDDFSEELDMGYHHG